MDKQVRAEVITVPSGTSMGNPAGDVWYVGKALTCVSHPSTHSNRRVCSLSTFDIFATDSCCSCVKAACVPFGSWEPPAPPPPAAACDQSCVTLSADMTSTP